MPLPTLLVAGNLRGQTEEETRALSTIIPIKYIMDWFAARQILSGVKNRFLVLASKTGSGKSTAFPAELFRTFREPIICTQPKILTTIKTVQQIIMATPENKAFFRLGENIGYSTGNIKMRARKTGILLATLQTLTSQLISFDDEKIMDSYKFILIDEVHERSISSDLTILLLRQFLRRNVSNPRCPFVVLMSATIDPDIFLTYFDVDKKDCYIQVEGMGHPIIERWPSFIKLTSGEFNKDGTLMTIKDYVADAARLAAHLVRTHGENTDGHADILIFMPGAPEIKAVASALQSLNKELVAAGKAPVSILSITSEAQRAMDINYQYLDMPLPQQTVYVNKKPYVPDRRIIISTTIAETGLTLDDLRYVIDNGFNRESEFNPVLDTYCLITKPAPQSRIIQRRGRVGRKFEGAFYPLYSIETYGKLQKYQFPDIISSDISEVGLYFVLSQIKDNPIFDMRNIELIDLPTPDSLYYLFNKLFTLGFIGDKCVKYNKEYYDDLAANIDTLIPLTITDTNNGNSAISETAIPFGITRSGMFISKLGLSPEYSRLILSSYYWKSSVLDICTIIAYLTTPDKLKPEKILWEKVYNLPFFKNAVWSRLIICDDFINGIILLNAALDFAAKQSNSMLGIMKFCEMAKVNYNGFKLFMKTREELIEMLIDNKFNITINDCNSLGNSKKNTIMDNITRLKYNIYDAFRHKMLYKTRDETYMTSYGVKVNTPVLFERKLYNIREEERADIILKSLPIFAVYHKVRFRSKFGYKMIYEASCDFISVLDGFVNVDNTFIQ